MLCLRLLLTISSCCVIVVVLLFLLFLVLLSDISSTTVIALVLAVPELEFRVGLAVEQKGCLICLAFGS